MAGVSLRKGGNVSLSKANDSAGSQIALTKILIGLGWQERVTSGDDFDLDAVAFICSPANRVRSDADFIFYNQLVSTCGSVNHFGDERKGGGGNNDDSEMIEVDLDRLDRNVEKIVICVTIHDGVNKRQNFGMVDNAYIRLVNVVDEIEILRYDLTEDASIETAMIFGEIYRYQNEWKFRAVGQGFSGGLGPLARHYGVNVE
jgi:tellurium resistance protein TerD